MKYRSAVLVLLLLSGCYHYDVDTFEKQCERTVLIEKDRDQLDAHAPFWAIFPTISFHPDAVRDDYAAVMNRLYMEKAENRAPRMAWREGTTLHLVNLSGLFIIEPEEMIKAWRDGIEKAKNNNHKDLRDKCIYGILAAFFDAMNIHSMESSDGFGIHWTDEVTVISTDRQARYKKYGFPPP
jgi:hypothetical protein